MEATLVNNFVEPGWPILDEAIPLGKVYRVDLDRVEWCQMTSTLTGRSVRLECIFALDDTKPGFIPLIALKLAGDS